MSYRRPLGFYPLFQIPLLLLWACLLAALLFWFLGIGRPTVAVAIALDLSSSTYETQFNAPDTVMAREVQAVKAYLNKNTPDILRQPNLVQVFGFADEARPLTSSFSDDNQQISQKLDQVLQPNLIGILGTGTNLDGAIEEIVNVLGKVGDRCRELLLVTDGEAFVSPETILQAKNARVRINAVIIGNDAPQISAATKATGGIYLSSEIHNLDALFTDKFFQHFNNNWRWILFWLSLAWIAFMWMLTMPLDRWLFQGIFKLPLNLSGRLALGNALFWTTATPLIVWKLYQIFDLVVPFFSSC